MPITANRTPFVVDDLFRKEGNGKLLTFRL